MSELNRIILNGEEYNINSDGQGITDDIKQALLQITSKVAYIDGGGQTYYQDLYNALYPPVNLSYITCVYTQSGTVYDTDSINSLKTDLVVTAHWADNTTTVVAGNDYTLSGILTVGTSTITVSYGGKTTTFNVTVTSNMLYHWDFTNSLIDTVNGREAILGGNNTSPTRNSTGLVFNDATQQVDFGEISLKGKTLEVDVASFEFVGSTSNHIRFIMCPTATGTTTGAGPLIYRANGGWTAYGATSDGSTSGTWAGTYFTDLSGSTNAIRNAFSGKTVKLVFASDSNNIELYVDNISKGTISNLVTSNFETLKIGAGYGGGSASNGDQCYDMTITDVRIYENGEE